MDPITLEKIRAMNNYKRVRFLHVFFQICVTAISLTVFISKSDLFHLFVSRVNAFFLVTLPDISSYLVQPRIMFVMCNVIVIILVGESKCVMSPNMTSTQTSDMYDEYVREKKANIPRQSSVEITQKMAVAQKNNLILTENHSTDKDHGSVEGDKLEDELETWEDAREEEEDIGTKRDAQEAMAGRIEHQEENGFPADDLNKRIEAFLARVNEQRRMEAKLVTVEV